MRILVYIGKRLVQSIFVLFIVTVIAFMLIRLAPGNPARLLLSDLATDEDVAVMERELGLDQPLLTQYYRYVTGLLQGNLGTSTSYQMPVLDLLPSRFSVTGVLTIGAMIVGVLLSIPLGVIAGAHRGTKTDFFCMCFALWGQSMSIVWLAVLNIYVFSVWWKLLPSMGGMDLEHLILPVVTLACPIAASITRIARSGMIDTLGEDYITSTLAKGMSKRVVYWKYAFKNAMIPVVILVGIMIAQHLAGAVVIETIFSFPGLGQLIYQSVGNRDYAVVQSLLLISAICFVVINLVVDIINSFIDPRITLE